MAEFPAGGERLLKQLISSYRCHTCRRPFKRERIRVSARGEDFWLISVRCAYCREWHLFGVTLRDEGAADTPLTDLSPEEEERFAALAPVSSDDILDVHEALARFSGDVSALFER